jgi:hypothetical protein
MIMCEDGEDYNCKTLSSYKDYKLVQTYLDNHSGTNSNKREHIRRKWMK